MARRASSSSSYRLYTIFFFLIAIAFPLLFSQSVRAEDQEPLEEKNDSKILGPGEFF
jgi:hypothetical protein